MSDHDSATPAHDQKLSFEAALKLKKDREAHGHGTVEPGDTRAEQLEVSTELTDEEQLESREAHDSEEDHDHTTNVPR
ncbi:hypothetical protein HJC99_06875 [Candidatus Saccharibacteria bacterium]|nr:hypothetical protein [Candidatus Saccharibacteria bacterium]